MSKQLKAVHLVFENVEGVTLYPSGIQFINLSHQSTSTLFHKDNGENVHKEHHVDLFTLCLSKETQSDPSHFDFSLMHDARDGAPSEVLIESVFNHFTACKDIVEVIVEYEDETKEVFIMPWGEDDWQYNTLQGYGEDAHDVFITVSTKEVE